MCVKKLESCRVDLLNPAVKYRPIHKRTAPFGLPPLSAGQVPTLGAFLQAPELSGRRIDCGDNGHQHLQVTRLHLIGEACWREDVEIGPFARFRFGALLRRMSIALGVARRGEDLRASRLTMSGAPGPFPKVPSNVCPRTISIPDR